MDRLSARGRTALAAERVASAASRRLGRGSGEVIGGRAALALAPGLLAELAAGRTVACVSGTNGKTTTTRLLHSALATAGPVASNSGGANMTEGVVAALCRQRGAPTAALEVDEIYLPVVARAVHPRVLVLLNVTRDQLDRSNETRRIAGLWRAVGAELPGCTAVANADDPLVVWAALGFGRQVWVGAGQNWTSDAAVCPACTGLLQRGDRRTGWWCDSCDLRRPVLAVQVPSAGVVQIGTVEHRLQLALPGQLNTGNAALAATAAAVLGVDYPQAFAAMETVTGVAGRYEITDVGGRQARLLLAKNPAGWLEMLGLLAESPDRPLVIAFNARVADGRDPSWIWDVPLEQLTGREVHVCGDRAEDLAVRLAYAGVACRVHPSAAAAAAAARPAPLLDVLATYTAFRELR